MPDYMVDPQERPIGPPNMAAQLFGMISSLPDAYQQGVKQKFERGQMARTEKLQEPYAGPFDPKTGMPDPVGIMHESMKRGGIEDAQKYVGPLLEMMAGNQIGQVLGGGGAPGGGGSPYSPSNPNTTPEAQGAATLGGRPQPRQEQRSDGETPQQVPAGENPAHQNIRQLAVNAGIDTESPEFKQAFRGTDIDREFMPGQQGALQRTGAAMRIKMLAGGDTGPAPSGATAALGRGQGTVYMPGPGPQGSPPVQMAQAAPGGPTTPVGTEADAKFYEDRANARMAASARPFAKPAAAAAAQKAAEADFARAKDIRDTLAKYGEPTTAQKNAPPGMSVQEAEAHAEGLKKTAEAKSKNVAGYIEGIKPARQTVQVLDEMDNALTQGWKHISTGPGARQFLEIKKAVNNWMPGTFQNVAEAETVDKLNAQLAAAAAKAMTARPSQLEFKAFMANNPGLLTSREGSKVLIDLLRQQKQQEIRLGQMADKLPPGKSFSDVEEKFYRDNPIISPFTHKPIDAKQAPDGKWYRPDPDRPGKYLAER